MDTVYPHATWRLYSQPVAAPAALNLAVDEAILRAVAVGEAPPTLRFYHFAAPSLILGRGQPFTDLDHQAIAEHRIKVVRRMSGGTAVLTGNDFAYAVMVAIDEPRLGGTIKESYRPISEALVVALQQLGLERAQTSPGEDAVNRYSRSPVCFEIPSMYEITVDDKKIVGNSQMRIRGGILQHGTIPLSGDMAGISQYLASHPNPEGIHLRTETLSGISGKDITWQTMANAFQAACTFHLNLDFDIVSTLTECERRSVAQILHEKYKNPSWTRRI